MKRIPILLACFLALGAARAAEKPTQQPGQPQQGPGGTTYPHALVRESRYGAGGKEYHLFEPDSPTPATAPVVVFLHGWTATDPWLYSAWIEHLVRRGNIVIYCRYQENFLTSPNDFTPNTVAALGAALAELKQPGHVSPDLGRFAITGHSVGGLLTVNLAALCAAKGFPEPRALFSVQPGVTRKRSGKGVPLEDLGKLPKDALLLCVTGEKDTVTGDADSRTILADSTSIPSSRKNIIVLTADNHGFPPLTASHLAPNSLAAKKGGVLAADGPGTPPPLGALVSMAAGDFAPLRKHLESPEGLAWAATPDGHRLLGEALDPPDAQDFALWRMFDRLCAAAFEGAGTDEALGRTEASLSMGNWSDGTPVKPMRALGDK